MMRKQIISIIAVVVVIIAILAVVLLLLGSDKENGCNVSNDSSIESKFIGEWENQSSAFSYIFKSNGSYYVNDSAINFQGIWTVKNGQICFFTQTGLDDYEWCRIFEFSNDDKTLTLYNDDNTIFWELIKQ